MALAIGSTSAKRTSPQRPDSVRWMPTSTTTAPGLTCSAPSIKGLPAATTSRSAWRVIVARSWVREWATVTVALAACSIRAMGWPTRMLRPTTTAR